MAATGERVRGSRSGYAVGYALLLSTGLAGMGLVLAASSSAPALPTLGPVVGGEHGQADLFADTAVDPDVGAMVNRYCVVCHSERRQLGNFVLESLDASNPAEHPEIWEKVLDKLRLGAMPPPGRARPDRETYADVGQWLEGQLDAAWVNNPNPGRIAAVHRLNRTEYNNAIRDLLAIDFDVRSQLPGDETTDGGFDNVAAALTLSTAHLERYMSVARQVTRLATGLPPIAPGVEIYRIDDLRTQEVRTSHDQPLGSRGGTAVLYHFPVPGEYIISIKLNTNYAEYFRGMGWAQELDVRLDGELLERFNIGAGALEHRPVPDTYAGDGSGPGWPGAPEWEEYMQAGAQEHLSVRVRVEAGPQVVSVSFPRSMWEDEILLPQQPLRLWGLAEKNSHDYMGHAGVSELHIDGPYQIADVAQDTPSRREIFTCRPESEETEEICAAEILSRMARRAYRRPATDEDVQSLLEFFRLGKADGGTFDAGIQIALERILVDPDFLLRVYRDPPTSSASRSTEPVSAAGRDLSGRSEIYPLTDLEVASRLAFFLWSSIPDEPLLDLAESRTLTDPPVLRGQVRRMLADPRAHDALVDGFASQWLMLRVLEELTADERLYPDFDHAMRDWFRQETELFVASTIREDRSVLDLLRADYTYVNERLARHYDIPNVTGSHFRRVALPDLEKRGGLLGHASILSVSSYPDRTSPVLRGKYLIENILGSHVPPPPPDLDTSLEAEEEASTGRAPTIRALLERHRENAACASCHSVMDPLGFALESFDALGGWRGIDEKGNDVDDLGRWPSGEDISSFSGLRAMLVEHDEQFARTVAGKLMSYALGRPTEYYDQPAVRKIVREAEAEDYSWSSIITGIVESAQFLTRARAQQSTQSR